jgi:hypothetical protein
VNDIKNATLHLVNDHNTFKFEKLNVETFLPTRVAIVINEDQCFIGFTKADNVVDSLGFWKTAKLNKNGSFRNKQFKEKICSFFEGVSEWKLEETEERNKFQILPILSQPKIFITDHEGQKLSETTYIGK